MEIDSIFQDFLHNTSVINTKLKNQQKIIRQQTLRLLLNGDFTEEMKAYLSDIALQLPGPYYCEFAIELQAESYLYTSNLFSDNNTQDDLLSLIYDLSDEEILLHPLSDNNSNLRIPVLISFSEVQQKDEAAEMIKELLEAKELSFVLGSGGIYNSLYEIPASYLEALSECKYKINSVMAKDQDENAVISSSDPLCYDTTAIADMLSAIRHGNCDLAIQILNRFISDLKNKNLPIIILRYIFSDILSELVHIGLQIQNPVSEQQASLILTANNTSAFYEGCLVIIKDM